MGEGGRRRRRREEDRNDEYTRSQQVAYSVQRRAAALAVQDGGRQAGQGKAVELGYSQFSAAIGIGCCRTLASLCSFPSLTEINTEGGRADGQTFLFFFLTSSPSSSSSVCGLIRWSALVRGGLDTTWDWTPLQPAFSNVCPFFFLS